MTTPQSPNLDELDEILQRAITAALNAAQEIILNPASNTNFAQQSHLALEAKREAVAAILKLIDEARFNELQKVLSKRRHTFQPVGGISNIQYIAVGDIERQLGLLKKDSKQ